MKKIRIAQIGINEHSHGANIWQSITKQNDLFEVVGYALPERERERLPQKMYRFEGYREMTVDEILTDHTIQAVAVETDEIYLTKYALMAAKAGKHIHMEKPGGAVLADFEELIATVKKNKLVFHTGYMYRYNPYVQELLEEAKQGKLGEILYVEAQMNCWHPPETHRFLNTLPGGMMFFLGCHLVDLILLLQGEPKNIIPLNKGADFGMAAFEYEKGISFAKTTATERGGFLRRQLVVCGTEKTVELRPFEKYVDGPLLITGRTESTVTKPWHEEGLYSECAPIDRYDAMMEGFAAYVRGEKQNPFTPDYELTLYKTLLNCLGEKK